MLMKSAILSDKMKKNPDFSSEFLECQSVFMEL